MAAPKPRCAHPAGWQKLANRVGVPVYCPGWLPDPLTSQIGGTWSNGNSVSPDRSYLESFVWQETEAGGTSGELHVNLRSYPGVIRVERSWDPVKGPIDPVGAGDSTSAGIACAVVVSLIGWMGPPATIFLAGLVLLLARLPFFMLFATRRPSIFGMLSCHNRA